MANLTPDEILKIKLQSIGALRPEAWKMIVQLKKEEFLKTDESLGRKAGRLAYIADGLLKEYDAKNRKRPSIINFIGNRQVLITRKHNQSHYLKACLPTLIYYWEFADLQQLYAEFKELKSIYDDLCAGYDEQANYRQLVLEQPHASDRIILFRTAYQREINFIKKKDIANYLMLYYDTFIRTYRKLL